MSTTRAQLAGGPAYLAFKSANIPMVSDMSLELNQEMMAINTACDGEVTQISTDVKMLAKGAPATWEHLTVIFPWLNPQNGPSIFGATDAAAVLNSSNGDTYTLTAAGVSKMPDIFLGIGKPILGDMELTGVVGTGTLPSGANSLYTIGSGSYTAATLDVTKFGQSSYSAAWGSITGFGALYAEEGWSITHKLELAVKKVQGLTMDITVKSYQAICSAKIIGPTQAQIDAALNAQGSTALWGVPNLVTGADLVITSATNSGSPVVTVKNAAIQKGGWRFGSSVMRNDMYSFVSSRTMTSGVPGAALVLA